MGLQSGIVGTAGTVGTDGTTGTAGMVETVGMGGDSSVSLDSKDGVRWYVRTMRPRRAMATKELGVVGDGNLDRSWIFGKGGKHRQMTGGETEDEGGGGDGSENGCSLEAAMYCWYITVGATYI